MHIEIEALKIASSIIAQAVQPKSMERAMSRFTYNGWYSVEMYIENDK
jgi:hypothetical protein